MVSFLRTNLVWMLLSLVLSTGLWVYVTFTKNPEVTNPLPNIPIEIQEAPKALWVQPETTTVQVVVSAPSDVWQQLKPDKFHAVVDASKVTPGLQEVEVKVVANDPRVRVEGVEPAKVFLKVEPLRNKSVPVQVVTSGTVPPGYQPEAPRVTPDHITVSGPESAVNQVQSALVAINLDGVTRSIDQTFKPVLQGISSTDAARVSSTPDGVLVQIRIDQKLGYKTLPVSPTIVGNVALGYQIVGITVDPETVTLVGDPQTLSQMTVVPTRPIDVNGADGDRAYDANLALPQTVAMDRSQTVVVRVLVSTLSGTKTFLVSPQVVNLGPGLTYTMNPGAVNVTLAGPVPVLTRIQPTDIVVTVDAGGLVSGAQSSLVVQVKSPDLLKVVSVQPQRVTLAVK